MQLTFAHISDTHICKTRPKPGGMFDITSSLDTGERLQKAICGALAVLQKPDFFVFTGDLVHDGSAEDYLHFKNIVESQLNGIPYFLTLGNHDNHEEFFKVFDFGTYCKQSGFYYSQMLGGLRIIALDSAEDETKSNGYLGEKQMNFLANELKTLAPFGTIILMHHPAQQTPFEEQSKFFCGDFTAFNKIIQNSDVFAVLCGHTHFSCVTQKNDILYSTAPSTAFSINTAAHGSLATCTPAGYNLCSIHKKQLYINTVELNFPGTTTACISYAQLNSLKSDMT